MVDKNLLKDFKSLEKQLVMVLKDAKIEIDENQKPSEIRKKIKCQIEKIGRAKELFDRYESLAKKIYIQDDDGSNAMEKPVIETKEKILPVQRNDKIIGKNDKTPKKSLKKNVEKTGFETINFSKQA